MDNIVSSRLFFYCSGIIQWQNTRCKERC